MGCVFEGISFCSWMKGQGGYDQQRPGSMLKSGAASWLLLMMSSLDLLNSRAIWATLSLLAAR